MSEQSKTAILGHEATTAWHRYRERWARVLCAEPLKTAEEGFVNGYCVGHGTGVVAERERIVAEIKNLITESSGGMKLAGDLLAELLRRVEKSE